MRLETTGSAGPGGSDEALLWTAGARAKGEFRCPGCGYGVTVYTRLPACPMCSGRVWAQTAWRPFGRAAAAGRR